MTDRTPDPEGAKELREGFARILEQHMNAIVSELEQLLEMHDRYGDTLQKSYLYKARRALKEGLDWFTWSRRQRSAPAMVADKG